MPIACGLMSIQLISVVSCAVGAGVSSCSESVSLSRSRMNPLFADVGCVSAVCCAGDGDAAAISACRV